MKGDLYTIVYAAALGLICALLLTVVGQATAPLIAENRKAEEMRNVLGVLGIEFDEASSSQQLAEIFERNVRRRELPGEPVVYEYIAAEDGSVLATALPVEGAGMWGRIRGFLALEPDGRTIRGVRFHEHEETPGLGGRISEEEFLARFPGRSIVDSSGQLGLRIKAQARQQNEVDVITGATTTCDKVEALLNETIRRLPAPEVKR